MKANPLHILVDSNITDRAIWTPRN